MPEMYVGGYLAPFDWPNACKLTSGGGPKSYDFSNKHSRQKFQLTLQTREGTQQVEEFKMEMLS